MYQNNRHRVKTNCHGLRLSGLRGFGRGGQIFMNFFLSGKVEVTAKTILSLESDRYSDGMIAAFLIETLLCQRDNRNEQTRGKELYIEIGGQRQ